MDDIYIIYISHIDFVVIAAYPAKPKPTQAHTHTTHTQTHTTHSFLHVLFDAILRAYMILYVYIVYDINRTYLFLTLLACKYSRQAYFLRRNALAYDRQSLNFVRSQRFLPGRFGPRLSMEF